MRSGKNFSTEIYEWLHVGNVTEAYQSTNNVSFIGQILKHNDACTGVDYTVETLSYLAVQGWNNISSAMVCNLVSAADKWHNACGAHLLHLQHCQEEACFRLISHQVHNSGETHVHEVCRSIKLTALQQASVDLGIPNIRQLFSIQNEEDWGHDVSGLVHGYDQNVLIDSILIIVQNGLLYYRQPFYCPISVEHLGINRKVLEYTNQGIMPESHNICIQYTESDPNNTFQVWIPAFPEL